MPTRSDAEENLRVIRSLMEKATIYRALSAQAALIGGLVACIAGAVLAGGNDPFVSLLTRGRVPAVNADLFGFELKWFVVLAITATVNFFFLYRDAQRRQEPFVSPGMRTALRAMTPALLSGAVFTSFCNREGIAQCWMLFYGLALLSTAHFAPGSIVRLGWAFLLTGLALLLIDARGVFGITPVSPIPLKGSEARPAWTYPDLLMACTFGGYHLLYAGATLMRKRSADDIASAAAT